MDYSKENIQRKQKIFDYVIKVTSDTLDLIRDNEDPLLKSLNYFINRNLGINVDVINERKYQILDSIQTQFEERSKRITENDLDKLELKINGLDRNNDKNIKIISDFILDNYNIHINPFDFGPSYDSYEIIDKIMEIIT